MQTPNNDTDTTDARDHVELASSAFESPTQKLTSNLKKLKELTESSEDSDEIPNSFNFILEANKIALIQEIRKNIYSVLMSNNLEQLTYLGFPSEIVNFWAQKIKLDVVFKERFINGYLVATYSHPEELDFYKVVGARKLSKIFDHLSSIGAAQPEVRAHTLDTVAGGHPSSQQPYYSYGFGPKDVLILNYAGKVMAGLIDEPIASAEDITKALIEPLLSYLRQEVHMRRVAALKARNEATEGVFNFPSTECIEALLKKRVCERIAVFTKSFGDVPFVARAGLRYAGEQVIRKVVESGTSTGHAERLIYLTGHMPFSEDTKELSRIREMLIDAQKIYRGNFPGILAPGKPKEVGFILDYETDKRRVYGVEPNGDVFAIVPDDNGGSTVVEASVDDLLREDFVPVGSVDIFQSMLCLAHHMGSEYNMREAFIKQLGFSGLAEILMQALRVGKDKAQGHEGIVILSESGASGYMSLPMAYALFGAETCWRVIEGDAEVFFYHNPTAIRAMQDFCTHRSSLLNDDEFNEFIHVEKDINTILEKLTTEVLQYLDDNSRIRFASVFRSFREKYGSPSTLEGWFINRIGEQIVGLVNADEQTIAEYNNQVSKKQNISLNPIPNIISELKRLSELTVDEGIVDQIQTLITGLGRVNNETTIAHIRNLVLSAKKLLETLRAKNILLSEEHNNRLKQLQVILEKGNYKTDGVQITDSVVKHLVDELISELLQINPEEA